MRLQSQTHPARYRMHKYWSRKPHNVVGAYIERYSRPGETVLDPFCGSGVTIAEAILRGRNAIGCDLNPMAVLISERTCRDVEPALLDAAFAAVRAAVGEAVAALYGIPCDCCRAAALLSHAIWERRYRPAGGKDTLPPWWGGGTLSYAQVLSRALDAGMRKGAVDRWLYLARQSGAVRAEDAPVAVRYACRRCGRKAERALSPAETAAWLEAEAAYDPLAVLPYTPLHATARQSVDAVHELFTRRNIHALGVIRDAIRGLDAEERGWMEFVFTSALSQASKLVFVIGRRGRDAGRTSGGREQVGSWTMPNYWAPPRHYEINAWHCFANRFVKVRRGKEEWRCLRAAAPQAAYQVVRHDVTALGASVASESVDYVFTDPPYGDAVPYLGVSLMWSTWLELDGRGDFERELHLSGGEDGAASLRRYRDGLARAAREVWRALKPGGYATWCFNTNRAEVWACLDDALEGAGFAPVERVFVAPARPSAKSLLAREGSMKGDVLVTVRKPV